MTTDKISEHDDIGEAVRENRPLRPARFYRFQLAQDGLNFQPCQVADPVPQGRQLLEAAGLRVRDDISLFAILPSGAFEDVRLDETFDLRAHGAERFIAFRTDCEFKLTLNGQELRWGKPAISGAVLYALAKPKQGEAVFLEVQGGQDRLIEPTELIDLTGSGIERFITADKPPLTFEIIVNARRRTVENEVVTFEQVVELAFPGHREGSLAFSVTYQHAASFPRSGELGAGGSVKVKPQGTIFNVTRTVES